MEKKREREGTSSTKRLGGQELTRPPTSSTSTTTTQDCPSPCALCFRGTNRIPTRVNRTSTSPRWGGKARRKRKAGPGACDKLCPPTLGWDPRTSIVNTHKLNSHHPTSSPRPFSAENCQAIPCISLDRGGLAAREREDGLGTGPSPSSLSDTKR